MAMKQIDGIWWPEADKHCHRVVPGQVADVDKALAYCERTRTCIQAGGNVGIWPRHLAKTFGTVWTFEPDEENFDCLNRNLSQIANIAAVNQGLGAEVSFMGMKREPENVGAHRMDGEGFYPITTIDAFGLQYADLIVLDIEGMEPLALKGAKETIRRHRPVIMVEDKGLSEHYGFPKGWSENMQGYRVAEKAHRDVILVPDD